jgi:hypothetical protein
VSSTLRISPEVKLPDEQGPDGEPTRADLEAKAGELQSLIRDMGVDMFVPYIEYEPRMDRLVVRLRDAPVTEHQAIRSHVILFEDNHPGWLERTFRAARYRWITFTALVLRKRLPSRELCIPIWVGFAIDCPKQRFRELALRHENVIPAKAILASLAKSHDAHEQNIFEAMDYRELFFLLNGQSVSF